MARTNAAEQAVSHRHWRALVDAFLRELLDLTQSDYAALIDLSTGRERYVFATREKPLPDINWHSVIRLLWFRQQADAKLLVADQSGLHKEEGLEALADYLDPDLFNVVGCIPLSQEDRLLAAACLFGRTPPVDLDLLAGELRPRLEGLARITSSALAAMAGGVSANGRHDIHQKALHTLPEGLLMADSDGVVVEANDAFSALTGIPADALIGRNLKEQPLLGTDCDYLVARLLESGQPFEVIARLGSTDSDIDDPLSLDDAPAERKFLRLRGTAYPQDGEGAGGMLLLADDVTRDVLAKREANRRERRYSQEIELASRLQQNFFPPTYQKKRIKIATRLIAARELAGDFFDIFDLGPNTIGLVIGDVVGKGIPSSLMAMSVHGMLANQAGALIPPMKVLERVNEGLYHQVRGEYWYATCFFAKIHVTQLRMTYSRAGHELPLWYRKDSEEVTFLEGEGLPLGIFPDSNYATMQVYLSEGDRLLFYTDGLTDTINAAGERFGHDRLVDLFRKNCTLSPKNLLKVIENEVMEFQGGREQLDDIALVLLSVVPDNWTTLTIPPYTFSEVLENLISELRLRGIEEETAFKVRLSLDECVTNAFRHGHRGDERRPITISYLIEPDKVTTKVRDQGPGFDFGLIPDPTLEENLMQVGGRGVFLTLKMMDEVRFNDVGNEVTMVKYLHGPGQPPSG